MLIDGSPALRPFADSPSVDVQKALLCDEHPCKNQELFRFGLRSANPIMPRNKLPCSVFSSGECCKRVVDPLEPDLFGLLLCTSRSASVCTCVCVCVHVFTCHSFSSSAIKASRVLLEAEKYLLMTISANLPKLSCFLKASRLLVIHVSRQRSIMMTYNCI